MRFALAAVAAALALAACAGPSAAPGTPGAAHTAISAPRPHLQVLQPAAPNRSACHHYAAMLNGLFTGQSRNTSAALTGFTAWARNHGSHVSAALLAPMTALASGYAKLGAAQRAALEGRIAGYCETIGVSTG